MSPVVRACAIACVGMMVVSQAAAAGHLPPPPDLDRRVGFDQRIGHDVPAELRFIAADGSTIRLADAIGGRPLVLALGYYRCPNLCGATLRGIANAVANTGLVPGRDFGVAFVSIDPREKPAAAAHERALLDADVPRAHADAWHLLTGAQDQISRLAKAIGFRYFHDARNGEYAHAAGLVVLTPAGRVAQYFFGVDFPPRSLRLALIGASRGKLGSVVDRLVLFCCGYDPATGRYSVVIGRVMAIVGTAFALAFAIVLLALRKRGRR